MPSMERKKLGEILIEQKFLTPFIVERILRISNDTHRRFGQTLEDMGLLTGDEIAQALAIQYGYKTVQGIFNYTIPQDVLALVPTEECFENRIFPLQVKGTSLALAMADPTAEETIKELSARLGLSVVPFVATTKEIMKAIARNHLGISVEQKADSVLIVDTDSGERRTLADVLTREGYHVAEAEDGDDGFKQALLQLPGLVITAKDMPFSDGFAFYTSLNSVAETRRIPVILLSHRSNPEEEATAFHRGFFDYIPMPVADITLVTRVERALAAGKSYMPRRHGYTHASLEMG